MVGGNELFTKKARIGQQRLPQVAKTKFSAFKSKSKSVSHSKASFGLPGTLYATREIQEASTEAAQENFYKTNKFAASLKQSKKKTDFERMSSIMRNQNFYLKHQLVETGAPVIQKNI